MSKSLKKLIDINGLREFKNKIVGTDSAYVQTSAVDQTIAGTKTFSKPIAGSVTGSSGSCTGNAATANIATKATQDSDGNKITTTYSKNGHTHDDRYYTEAEVNNLLAGKANTSHTHNSVRTPDNSHVIGLDWSSQVPGCVGITVDVTRMGGIVTTKSEIIVHVGVIIPFAGTSVPTGYLLCNGAAVSRTYYANLFAAIGTLYGAGDGSTTFNLPDARDRVLQGASGWHSAGSYIAAGLPNITGYITQGAQCAAIQGAYGAFYGGQAEQCHAQQNSYGAIFPGAVYFDASGSSRIYGASSTVQSPAIATNFIIKY